MSTRRASSSAPQTMTGSAETRFEDPGYSFVRTTGEGRDIPAIGSAVPYQRGRPDLRALLVAVVALGVGLGALIGLVLMSRMLP